MRFTFLRRWVPGAMLLVAAGASSALTLGRAQGVALIGRPLEVGLQIGLDSAAEANDLCTEAEVFYGETRVEQRRVELRTIPQADAVAVRVRVAAPVDEAYVTVYLRVGCNQKLTRRYVLLSEQPGDQAEAAAQPSPVAPPAAALAPAVPPAPAGGSGAVGRDAGSPARAPRALAVPLPAGTASAPPAAAAVAPASAARRAPPVRPAPAPAAAPPAEARPRLKLEAVDVRPRMAASAARPATPEAAAAPLRPESTAQAQALSAAAEELQRSAERIQAMEADLKVLREGMLKRDAALTELRDRLERAEHERYANGLVYGLSALLAGAVGLALALWWRGRKTASPDWWGESRQPDPEPSVEEGAWVEDPLVTAALSPTPAKPVSPAPAATAEGLARPAANAAAAVAAPTPAPGAPRAAAGPAARRSAFGDAEGLRVSDPLPLTSDELCDIQQEADFFVSLGEYDRAIEVLRNHIEAHPQASPVAWLDLLEIQHKLQREEEYEQLRRDFEWLFNAKAPAFARFAEDQQGLESYPRLLAAVQAAWPAPGVLQVIDDAIFRRPGTDGEESLSLQAYRDLLFLHNVAAEMAASTGAAPQPATGGASVDIDLDELAGLGADTQPAPMVVPAMPAPRANADNSLDFDFEPVPPRQPPSGRP